VVNESVAAAVILAQRREYERLRGKLTARQRGIMAKALERMLADLDRARPGTWTEAERRATIVQVTDAMRDLAGDQFKDLARTLPVFARLAAKDVAAYLGALDREFLGAVRPMRWASLDWVKGYERPLMRSRLRIFRKSFERYGGAAVREIEDLVATRTTLGMPWTDARDEVMKVVGDVVQGRQWMVDRILRTEAKTVYSATTMAALFEEDSDDDPMLKKLVATFDVRTADDSRALHGQAVPVRELFTDVLTGRSFDHPPNRPNDREDIVGWRTSWGSDEDFDAETATEI
jgi:hypothetical protein